jgi:hypothetical protein
VCHLLPFALGWSSFFLVTEQPLTLLRPPPSSSFSPAPSPASLPILSYHRLLALCMDVDVWSTQPVAGCWWCWGWGRVGRFTSTSGTVLQPLASCLAAGRGTHSHAPESHANHQTLCGYAVFGEPVGGGYMVQDGLVSVACSGQGGLWIVKLQGLVDVHHSSPHPHPPPPWMQVYEEKDRARDRTLGSSKGSAGAALTVTTTSGPRSPRGAAGTPSSPAHLDSPGRTCWRAVHVWHPVPLPPPPHTHTLICR